MKNRSISYDENWREKYSDMLHTPAEAAACIRPGQRVFIGTGCAQPHQLVKAMTARSKDLADTEIIHLLTQGDAPYATRDLAESFRINSFFIADNVRTVIQEALGDYTPIFLSDIPRLFSSGQVPLDVALIQVTPPDQRGRCSFGVSVDIVKSAAANAATVIAEINPEMPRTLGDSFIDINDIDILVPVEYPIVEVQPPVPTDEIKRIGQYVAGLVEDGSTIEFGIGQIPQAVTEYLKDKKNLGIHTEMFSDAMIDLIESGAVDGSRKSKDRNKIVASFCMGTKRIYDYIDNNPVFSFNPTEYVNDPMLISQQNRQIAINVALEADLTGQICADSIGTSFYSGIGGQVDFNRGAGRSPGGKAIIAMPSTAKDGTVSRIVTRLSPGAGVVTTRGDVHYIVTEYGVAYLHGKSVQQRAMALISIAHPDFREQLLNEAIEAKYLRAEFADIEGKLQVGRPDFRTSYLLNDGTQINFRPIHPTDEDKVRDLFYALSQETIYYRFMSNIKTIPRKQIMNFVYIDHRKDVALVGTVPEASGEEIVAIGRYYLDEKTNSAEVAFVVRDAWQNKGIGKFLLKHLAVLARRNGISAFTAEVLRANRPMQHIFNNFDYKVTSEPREEMISYRIEFNA